MGSWGLVGVPWVPGLRSVAVVARSPLSKVFLGVFALNSGQASTTDFDSPGLLGVGGSLSVRTSLNPWLSNSFDSPPGNGVAAGSVVPAESDIAVGLVSDGTSLGVPVPELVLSALTLSELNGVLVGIGGHWVSVPSVVLGESDGVVVVNVENSVSVHRRHNLEELSGLESTVGVGVASIEDLSIEGSWVGWSWAFELTGLNVFTSGSSIGRWVDSGSGGSSQDQ